MKAERWTWSLRRGAPRALALAGLLALGGCALQGETRPGGDGAGDLPSDLMEVQRLAREAYDQERWDEAARYYRALTRRVPAEVEPWFRLGNVYARLERPEAAVGAYQEALVREPELAKAWYNMGVLQLRQAMNSFAQMQAFGEPGEPLHERGQAVYRQLQGILGGGGGGGGGE